MANFWYTEGLRLALTGGLNAPSNTLRARLFRTGSTHGTEKDVTTMDGFTTKNECDGANYAAQTLANVAVSIDAGNNRVKITCDDPAWTNLGANSSGDNIACVIEKRVTDDTDSPPILHIDQGGFPFNGSGSTVTLEVHADGLARLTGS